MPRGGARPGAGRKRVRERFEKPVEVAEKRIADRLPFLVDKLFEMAEAGEFKAASYLVDRVLGKPRQSVDAEVTGANGGALRIVVEYDDPSPNQDPVTETAPGAAADSG
jgi:hypothetical protein